MNWEYITGFFDADGSVTIVVGSKGRKKSPQISFHNNEMNILIEIQQYIEKELRIKGFISAKRKTKEHHNQAYDLKYVDFPKCVKIMDKINTIHDKKKKRFDVIKRLYKLTPRNGKYTQEMLEERCKLEEEFFE